MNLFSRIWSFLSGASRSAPARKGSNKVNHIVVLVLENRSFDHMLGSLKSSTYPIAGLNGDEANYEHPQAQTGRKVVVSNGAPYVPDVDPSPNHDFPNVAMQLFGQTTVPQEPGLHNNGFLYDYATITHNIVTANKVMHCFAPGKLPVLTALAKNFAVCDHWFSSLPGPTWPNRFFLHCATSGGHVDNTVRM